MFPNGSKTEVEKSETLFNLKTQPYKEHIVSINYKPRPAICR
nr:MAG TPA: hypothetical protein [Caudoviricetes sp.]